MRPQKFPIALLIQLGNPHAVLVRFHVLRHNIHRHLAQIQIRPDPRRRRDARFL